MSVADPISDFLTVLRNASRARKERITVRTSRLITCLAEILKREGFVENVRVIDDGGKRSLRIHLKYVNHEEPALRSVVRVSKPSLRRYVKCRAIPRVLGGLGVAILSTPKGLLTGDEARKNKVGGELLCKVW